MSCFSPTLRRRAIGRAVCALAGLLWLGIPAHAGTLTACVRCSSPNETYRCNVMSDEVVRPDAVRYFCMSQIAREHVHESCAVLRAGASCDGVDVSYVYQDGVDDQAAGAEADPPGAAEDKKEPGTLADMTRSTVDASVKAGKAVGEATAKAGAAVGEATKRTLKCLGSALNGC
jgi:hypothetical protein